MMIDLPAKMHKITIKEKLLLWLQASITSLFTVLSEVPPRTHTPPTLFFVHAVSHNSILQEVFECGPECINCGYRNLFAVKKDSSNIWWTRLSALCAHCVLV